MSTLPLTDSRGRRRIPVRRARGAGPADSTLDIDVASLRRRLEETVSGEVRFDSTSLGLYANDASSFRQVPLGVVLPKSAEDIVATHRACAEHGAPIVNRGGGTSLSGETVNFALVIDTSKYMHRIGEIDAERRTVRAQPGVINEQLNVKVGSAAGLVFGPDPSSHSRCTIGGNVGNNSCGIHSVQAQFYGPGPRTSDNTEALEVVTLRRRPLLGWRRRGGPPRGDHRRPAGARARSTPPCVTVTRTPSGRGSSRRASCRGACRATTSTSCCPSAGSTSPAPWWGRRVPA